ncbi:MAG: methylmalonyl Co-A mutase-associated GTPase MeaB [Bacteroidia bacterium]|nr:methylmalonyl Co-A mutase-associated GTPase MeaB [Bacteroidia bacterium]
MNSIDQLTAGMRSGDRKSLARAITIVENDLEGASEILMSLETQNLPPVIGVTGPPGAGKSTLINELISFYTKAGERVAVIAVDPTSPFTSGSLLGDRLRMPDHFNNPLVFIRSLATRGALGGLSAKAVEVTDLIRNAGFDRVIIETVGVGQSEVEIAGLADITLLVLVPEAGDDIQALKSGVMEIADVFVVNKSDRPGADTFIRNIGSLLHGNAAHAIDREVIKTAAHYGEGITELAAAIERYAQHGITPVRKAQLYAIKAWKIISQQRMQNVDREMLLKNIENELKSGKFQLYRFCSGYYQ